MQQLVSICITFSGSAAWHSKPFPALPCCQPVSTCSADPFSPMLPTTISQRVKGNNIKVHWEVAVTCERCEVNMLHLHSLHLFSGHSFQASAGSQTLLTNIAVVNYSCTVQYCFCLQEGFTPKPPSLHSLRLPWSLPCPGPTPCLQQYLWHITVLQYSTAFVCLFVCLFIDTP